MYLYSSCKNKCYSEIFLVVSMKHSKYCNVVKPDSDSPELLTSTGEDDHLLEECEDHGGPGLVVVEDGERPQLGGNTVRPSDGRVTQLSQYPHYPGVVGRLAGISKREGGSFKLMCARFLRFLKSVLTCPDLTTGS